MGEIDIQPWTGLYPANVSADLTGSGVLSQMDLATHRFSQAVQDGMVYRLLLIELVLFAMLACSIWGFAISGMDRGTEFVAGGGFYPLWVQFFMASVSFALVAEALFVVAENARGERVTIAMHEGPEVGAL